jgi:hypothetical protein
VVLVAVGAREPDVVEAICEMGPAESRGCRLPRPARSIPTRKGCCERLQGRFAAFATIVSKRMLCSGGRFFSVLYNSGGEGTLLSTEGAYSRDMGRGNSRGGGEGRGAA